MRNKMITYAAMGNKIWFKGNEPTPWHKELVQMSHDNKTVYYFAGTGASTVFKNPLRYKEK